MEEATPLLVFPVDWEGVDFGIEEDQEHYEVRCWGKSPEGTAVLLRVLFYPYFFVKAPTNWSEAQQKLFVTTAISKLGALHGLSLPVKRTPLLGFTNSAKLPFIQLAFKTQASFRKARNTIPRNDAFHKLRTYESSLDPILRFFHVRNVSPSHWVSASEYEIIGEDDDRRISTPGVMEYMANFQNVQGESTCALRPPLILASWDIECVSASGKFPMPSLPNDKIITIGVAFQRYGEKEIFHRTAVALGTCDAIDGVEVIPCATEADVINTFFDVLHHHDADIMVGYNTLGFDFKYLDGRAAVCVDDNGGPLAHLSRLGKQLHGGGIPIEKNLSSGAYGDNKYFFLSSPGVAQLDLLQVFRKELKLDSYSLANVSKKYLENETKLDLPPGAIFEKFKGSSADRAEIARYCVRDVELPLKLMMRLCTLENILEMSNGTCVPTSFLQTRGQQIRVFSLLTRKARELGFVAPDIDRLPNAGGETKYEGATVLDAQKGAYFEVISALDFASLYPSIIMAWNYCPSTIVKDPKYGDLPGVEYKTVVTGQGLCRFAQGVQSVVPVLLKELAMLRKQAKKDMAAAKDQGDSFMVAMYNGKQLAFKVSMNSVYGFFGATKGLLPLVDMAAAVTSTGRSMIEHSKKMAEDLVPGTEVVYGDSVAEYTPLYIRMPHGGVYVTTFEELAQNVEWAPRNDGKEHAEVPPGMDIWSDCGWTPLHRIIRHALDPSKGMVRVCTSSGMVDVTTDHSLLLVDASPVKPEDVGVGTDLLHHDLPQIVPPSDLYATLTDMEVARIAGSIGHNKPVPGVILAASREIREAYWRGMCGTVSAYSLPIHHGKHLSLATIVLLADSLGYAYELGSHQVLFSINTHTPHGNKCEQQIRGMHRISYTGSFVYDVTTANHHFAAGIGRLIVHNTDSILCKFKVSEDKRYDMNEHFRIAQEVADTITKTFKHPIELEFEKCYYPYMLMSKKRYAGLLYTKPDKPDYIDVKGLQLVRRDNARIVKTVSQRILDSIMYDRSPEKAVEAARDAVRRVLNHAEPLEEYIITKALRASYANPNSQPHVQVANKIKARRGFPVTQGERIPYVFIDDPENCDGLLSSRAEDPAFVEAQGLHVDALYYINNQLLAPMTTLLELIVDDVHQDVLGVPGIAEKMEELKAQRAGEIKTAKRIRVNTTRKQHEITKFFIKKEEM